MSFVCSVACSWISRFSTNQVESRISSWECGAPCFCPLPVSSPYEQSKYTFCLQSRGLPRASSLIQCFLWHPTTPLHPYAGYPPFFTKWPESPMLLQRTTNVRFQGIGITAIERKTQISIYHCYWNVWAGIRILTDEWPRGAARKTKKGAYSSFQIWYILCCFDLQLLPIKMNLLMLCKPVPWEISKPYNFSKGWDFWSERRVPHLPKRRFNNRYRRRKNS